MTSERLSHFTNEQGEKQTCNVEMRSDQDVSVFTSCLPTTSTRPRVLVFYLLPPRHLYKRIYFNPGLGGGPPGADLVMREQSMEQ